MDQTTRNENESINAGCLFFVEDVFRVVGVYLLREKFSQDMHYNGKEVYLDLRITPKTLAHYLIVIFAKNIHKQSELNSGLPISAFPFDQLLLLLSRRKISTLMKSNICFDVARHCVYRRKNS